MRMRSLSWILLLVTALLLALWWGRDQPALQAWLPDALRQAPAVPTLPNLGTAAGANPAAAARKCVGAGALVTYTNGPCPAGTREQALDGGTLSVLPAVRAPAAAAAAETAGSAQAPLRRLAGPDDSAAQRERVLEQALHR